MTSRENSNQWHWDGDRHRWVYMGNSASQNPTYRWELKRDSMVYDNKLMMDAIDVACKNMDRFPDADKIIQGLQKNLDNKD